MINNLDAETNPFEEKPKQKQIKQWSGCQPCWEKFCEANTEYKVYK